MRERTGSLVKLLPDVVDLGGRRVLDIGIGTADVWAQLHRTGVVPARITGVDISARMLELANARNLVFLKTVHGTADLLPQPLRFDVATAMGVMRQCEDPGGLAARVHQHLRPNGTLLVEDLGARDTTVRLGMAATRRNADLLPQRVRSSLFLTDDALRETIEAAGFRTVRWVPYGHRLAFGSIVEVCAYLLNETLMGWRISGLPEEERRPIQSRLHDMCKEILGGTVLRREFFVATFEAR